MQEAVDIYRGLAGDPATRLDYATALNNLAADLVTLGDFAKAEAFYEEALDISRALDLPWGVALVLGNLGRLAALDGRTVQARGHFDRGVDQARRLGSPRMLGDALAGKARFERDYGFLENSVEPYRESVRVFESADYPLGVQYTNADMAIAYLRLGMADQAVQLFLPNAVALLDQEETLTQAGIVFDLALGRAEIEMAVGSIDTGAMLVGFVDGLIELGGYDDFLPRIQRLQAEAEKRMGTDRYRAAAAQGREMILEDAARSDCGGGGN